MPDLVSQIHLVDSDVLLLLKLTPQISFPPPQGVLNAWDQHPAAPERQEHLPLRCHFDQSCCTSALGILCHMVIDKKHILAHYFGTLAIRLKPNGQQDNADPHSDWSHMAALVKPVWISLTGPSGGVPVGWTAGTEAGGGNCDCSCGSGGYVGGGGSSSLEARGITLQKKICLR